MPSQKKKSNPRAATDLRTHLSKIMIPIRLYCNVIILSRFYTYINWCNDPLSVEIDKQDTSL